MIPGYNVDNVSLKPESMEKFFRKFFNCAIIMTIATILVFHHFNHDAITQDFQVGLSRQFERQYLNLLMVLMKQMDKYNITYIPSGGTLIGIYRHHGIIPWDDDIDIALLDRERHKAIHALSELNQTHFLYQNVDVWKFFKLDAMKMDSQQTLPFLYPNIDIFILADYEDNKYRNNPFTNFVFSRNITFPLVKRYFNGLLLYSPCDMEGTFQELKIDTNTCISRHTSHYKVIDLNATSLNCTILKPYYPFVERQETKKGHKIIVVEKLKMLYKTIHTARYSRPISCTDQLSFYPSDLTIF